MSGPRLGDLSINRMLGGICDMNSKIESQQFLIIVLKPEGYCVSVASLQLSHDSIVG